MKNLSNAVVLLLSATILSSCSVSAVQGGTKAAEQKGGLFGLMKQDDLKVDGEAAFKGAEEVVVASFKVGFIEDSKDRAKAGRGFGGNSTANTELKGINDTIKQQITDAAYADFISQLKANGYKVADRSGLLKDKDFSGAKVYNFPYDDDGIEYFAPKAHDKKGYFFMGESPDFMGGFAFGNPSTSAPTYAEKTGQKVISVLYNVDFVNSEGSGGTFSMTSSMTVGQGISVTPGSNVTFIGGVGGAFDNKYGKITLGQPVYSVKEFGTIKNTSSDAYIAAETALNVATALMGAGTNQSRSFEVTADPAKYKAIATEVLKDTNKAVALKISSLK